MSTNHQLAPKESLIMGSGRQLALIAGDDDDAVAVPTAILVEAEQRGTFSGERLFLLHPRIYRAVAKMLAQGESYIAIESLLEVSPSTIRSVREREGVTIEAERARVGQTALDVARLSFETLRERLEDPIQRAKLSAKDLAVMAGIATQNGQLLNGGPTARMETTQGAPSHDAYLRFLDSLRNVTPTGSSTQDPALKEAASDATDTRLAADRQQPIEVTAKPADDPHS